MNIGLIDVDGHNFPNLALMKISAYRKSIGDTVKWYDPLFDDNHLDLVYASKIFTFTPDYKYFPNCGVIKGGTGYDIKRKLPDDIDAMPPDYSIYPDCNYAMGFLTRGCVNKCPWCIVPEKEGGIKSYADIEEVATRKNVVLMDNNILSCEYGIKQIEKIGNMNIKIDFNQGLDSKMIDSSVAKLLSRCKWYKPLRMACDTVANIPHIERAVKLLRENKCTPSNYFCYVLVKNIDDALERVEFLRKIKVDPFAQPYRDFKNNIEPTDEQKRFSRWVNHKAIFKSVKWENYK